MLNARRLFLFMLGCFVLCVGPVYSSGQGHSKVRLDQLLVYVKDNTLPYLDNEDVVDYVEWMLKMKLSALNLVKFLDDELGDKLLRAVTSDKCSALKGNMELLCFSLQKYDLDKFVSKVKKVFKDTDWEESDFKVAFYIYVYYRTNGKELKKFAKFDFVAAYIYEFLSVPDCGYIAKHHLDVFIKNVELYYSNPSVIDSLDLGSFRYLVKIKGNMDFLKFKRLYL